MLTVHFFDIEFTGDIQMLFRGVVVSDQPGEKQGESVSGAERRGVPASRCAFEKIRTDFAQNL
jgi:hypothetical protein